MANWREVDETDLAATISQREIDAFRKDGPLDGSDPVARLLASTADTVRGYIGCNGAVRMGPAGTIPRGLIIPAMDYAAAKVLNRIRVPLGDDRRAALERAENLFEKIAAGDITVTENGTVARGICSVQDGFLTDVVERTKIEKRGADAAYTEDGETDDDSRPASRPGFAPARPERLLD